MVLGGDPLNEEQYKKVCEACDHVLMAPGMRLERIAVPWLHVLREHPSFLKDYQSLFAAPGVLSAAVHFVVAKGRSYAGWLRQMWRAFRSDGAPWRSSQVLSGPADVLFISHLLNDADAGSPTDFYFGDLPEAIREQGRRVVVALIDHSAPLHSSRALRGAGGGEGRFLQHA